MYQTAYHSKDLSKHSFLITGGAGFIGSHLVEYLLKWKAGRVVVIDNLITGSVKNLEAFEGNPALEFIEGDIRNYEVCLKALKGIDYVLHQAALGSVPRSVENPIATNEHNITGYLNMLFAAKEMKVKRFVYASSSSVYGDSKNLPKTEAVIGKPLSPYAVTKLVNEQYADVFSKTYGMEIIGLRYFNIFGPRQNPKGPYAAAIPLFMDGLISDTPVYINGDGEQTRDFTFVQNAVQANIKALFCELSEETPRIYNVAVSDRISINQLYLLLKELTGSKNDAIHREERAGDIRDSLADVSRAEKFLNYHPEITLKQGLSVTLEWFKHEFYPA
jgi:UDP-N-acetylglucosamine/UDP-N-acetylgalactosamine 4-epimerase